MTSDLAVVRLDVLTGERLQVGAVVQRLDGAYLVQWDGGGGREEITPSDVDRVVARGSLKFGALISPDRFRAAFGADPVSIFLRVLREEGEPMSNGQIRACLVALGLDKQLVTDTWKAQRTALLETEQVAVEGTGPSRTYRWTAPPVVVEAEVDDTEERRFSPAEGLIVTAAAQARNAGSVTPEQRAAAAELLAGSAAGVGPAVLAELVELAAVVADGGAEHADGWESTARRIAGLATKAGSADVETVDRERLAGFAALLPWDPDGGRVALLRAVAVAWPEEIAEPRWWDGVTLSVLLAAAEGGLAVVTSREDVSARVVRPLVQRELGAVDSLADLGAVLTLPRDFVASVPAESVAEVLRWLAEDDPVVAGWLRALTGVDESGDESGDEPAAEESTADAGAGQQA